MADRDRVRAEGKRLGDIATVADTAGIDQRNLASLAQIVDRPTSLPDRGHAGHAGVLGRQVRAGAGAALHAVDVDRVRVAFHRHADIVIDAGGAELELNRDLPVGCLPDFENLQRQIVGPQPVGMPSR